MCLALTKHVCRSLLFVFTTVQVELVAVYVSSSCSRLRISMQVS